MKAPADKSPDTQRQAAAHEAPHQQASAEAEYEFVDNREETADLRQLQEVADNSPQAQGLAQLSAMMNNSPRSAAMQNLQAMVDNSPRQVAQRQQHSRVQSASMGLQAGSDDVPVQRVEDEELLQGEFAAESPVQLAEPPDEKPNNTGLPDHLKAGVESLSGMSLDNVKVHYNSSEPAQLNAHAYAQGTDIHVGPGQEQHLPHEAWHVVQQAQGRVKPTLQMRGGVSVNDDQGLEREADLMGGKAVAGVVQAKQESGSSIESDPVGCIGCGGSTSLSGNDSNEKVIQGMFGFDDAALDYYVGQLVITMGVVAAPIALNWLQFRWGGRELAAEGHEREDDKGKGELNEDADLGGKADAQAEKVPSAREILQMISQLKMNPMASTRTNMAAKLIHEELDYNKKYTKNGHYIRITHEIIKILISGVAAPQDLEDDRGQKGFIGPMQAAQAVGALMCMPEEDYGNIVASIPYDEIPKAALILKAVAARSHAYRDEAGKHATEEVLGFAKDIQATNEKDLALMTSLRDMADRDTGLQQRFVNACVPTSIQVMKGELDPVYALRLNKEDNYSEAPLNPSSLAANEQSQMLPTKDNPPIGLKNMYEGLVVNLGKIDAQISGPIIAWLQGEGEEGEGASLAETMEIPLQLLSGIRHFYPFKAAGSNYQQTEEMAKRAGRATSTYVEMQIVSGGIHEVLGDLTIDMIEAIDRTLLTGQPVPFGVTFTKKLPKGWASVTEEDPQHELVFVDIRGEEEKGYEYLAYEPAQGRSFWVSKAEVIEGKMVVAEQQVKVSHIIVI